MKYESTRQLYICYHLISASLENPISSEQLAQYASCSVRTVKSEIKVLDKKLSDEHIANIKSVQKKGYYLNALDAREFINYVKYTNRLIFVYRFNDIDELNKRTYLIQTLLSEKTITMDEMANRVHYSRYSFQGIMKWVKDFFNSFDIEVKSEAVVGYSLSGKEANLRACMVEAFCSQYYLVEKSEDFTVTKFENMFYENDQDYVDLRHAFLKILRESKISIKDIDTKKIATYIMLLKDRISKGYHVDVGEKEAEEIKQTYEYTLSKNVFKDPLIQKWVQPSENEMIHFAGLLLVYRDYHINKIDAFSPLLYKVLDESTGVLYEAEKRMQTTIGKNLFALELYELFRNDLISVLMNIVLMKRYRMSGRIRLITYVETVSEDITPIANEIARNLLYHVQNILQVESNDFYVTIFANIFEYIFQRIKYSYQKQRLACVSVCGLIIAKHMSEELLTSYGNYILNADVYNQYELRRINFDDYDIVICDTEGYENNYPLPYVTYRPFNPNYNQTYLFHNVFKYGFTTIRMEEIVRFTNTHVAFTVLEKGEIYDGIAHLLCQDPLKQVKDWQDKEKICSHLDNKNQIVVLFCNYDYTQKEFIEIFKTSKKSLWENQHINYIITVSIDPDISVNDMKLSNCVLNYLMNDSQLIKDLYENKVRCLNHIFNMAIQQEFNWWHR